MKSFLFYAALLTGTFLFLTTCQKEETGPVENTPEDIEFRHDSSMPTSALEKEALEALYNATNGANWTNSTNWMVGDPCMQSWYGVFCYQGKVGGLNLPSNNLTGAIPSELGNLSNLVILLLSENQLSGVIPPELGNIPNLSFLWLYFNQLAGPIPKELANLQSIESIWLSNNLLECYEPGLENLRRGIFHFEVFYNPGPDGNGLPEFQDFVDTGAGTCVTEPDDQVIELEEQLQDFIDNGWVDPNGSESLFNQLDQAFGALCEGDIQQAIHKLEVFITLVEAKMPNQIDPAHGQELIDAAQAIIDLLESGEFEVNCE